MSRRFNGEGFEMKSYLATERTLERARESARALDDMGATLRKMDILLTAMWGLVQEIGITQDELNERIDRIVTNNESLLARRNKGICPKCNKQVSESPKTPFRGQCLYCGSSVSFYPDFCTAGREDEPAADEMPAEDQQEPVDPFNPDSLPLANDPFGMDDFG